MNGHDIYANTSQSSNVTGSSAQTPSSNLTMLHSVPNAGATSGASQSWQTGSSNF